jgi:serine/threonine protein kinase
MRFYAAEVILGLEHMHQRCVVYRDLKVRVAPWGSFSPIGSCPCQSSSACSARVGPCHPGRHGNHGACAPLVQQIPESEALAC